MSAGVRVIGWGIFALTCLLVGVGGWLGAYGGHRGQPDDAYWRWRSR